MPVSDPLRVGFIGAGAIATTAIRALLTHASSVFVAGVYARSTFRDEVAALLPARARKTSLDALIAERPDLVVECAGHDALRSHGPGVLSAGIDLMLVSSGALAERSTLVQLDEQARLGGAALRVVPGAIGALDWLSAAALAGLEQVTYRIRKPPAAWGAALQATPEEAIVLHRSSVREAAPLYPRNVNAASTVALVGIGFDHTHLELVADPAIAHNVHEIEARGAAGNLWFKVLNTPEPDHPQTSLITGYSVAHALIAGRGIPVTLESIERPSKR